MDRLTSEERERYALLASDVYDHAFAALDAEPDWDGASAGAVATVCEQAFLRAVTAFILHQEAA